MNIFDLLTNSSIRVYATTLTQASTAAPTEGAVINTFGAPLVWARSGAGVYTLTLTGAFPAGGRTLIFPPKTAQAAGDTMSACYAIRTSANVITLSTFTLSLETGPVLQLAAADAVLTGDAFMVLVI